MSHLALIPVLEALPGWPEVYSPGLLDIGLLILGWPLAIAAVITLFFMGPHWFRKSQGTGKDVERA